MVNLYRMGQEVIEEKKKFNAQYNGLMESQYCKLGKEQWEEHIIEQEEHYIKTCILYGDEPNRAVLQWDM